MRISVIIVSYNVKEFLQQCILSLKNALDGMEHEIIVVDNDSVDGSVNLIRQKFPEILLIENHFNKGFAAACNQGLAIARGEFILLLNPDTMLQEDTINVMVKFFEDHPEAGAAGCKILNADGTLQLACRRTFPTPAVALPKLLGLSRLFPKVKAFSRYNLTYLDPDQMTEVDAVSGSFLMFRRTVYEKIGGLDEAYFLYGEDLDYCYRIKKGGWKIFYVPGTKIIHYKGESTKHAAFDNFVVFYRAMDIFSRKHFTRSYSLVTDIIFKCGIFFRGLISFGGRIFRRRIVMFVDGIALSAAILVAHQLQPRPIPGYSSLLSMLIFYLLLWLGTGYSIGLYDRRELSYSRAVVASVLSFFASLIFNLAFKDFIYSPHMLIWSFIIVTLFLPGWRVILLFLQRRRIIQPASSLSKALLSRRTIIIGAGKEGERIARKLKTHIEHGFEILGFVDKNYGSEDIVGFPFLGLVSDLPEIIRINRATEIIFTTDRFNNDDILGIVDRIKQYRTNIKIVPRQLDYILGKSSVENIEDIPLLEVDYNLFHMGNRVSKRVFDLVVSVTGVILLAPFMIPLAYLMGYKFHKTVFIGVEGTQIEALTFIKRNGGNHARVFINRFPLLFSIIAGDLSLVGSELIPVGNSERSLRYKPGLTGLFRVSKNHRTDEIDKQNYEYLYMQNHSLFLDVEIILKTILKI
ncbi:MAG: glycosyltransferase [Candidatus Marinimicrobia bacterium]|nr:glycosyltransferase [Candidatus Neomarinimicrobiota bacterium]